MVAKGNSLGDILDHLCRLVEELSPGVLASILLMDPNGRQLRHGAAPNLPKAYNDTIDGLVIGNSAGSCGTAAYRAEQVIVSDIANDPLWADFRELALAHFAPRVLVYADLFIRRQCDWNICHVLSRAP